MITDIENGLVNGVYDSSLNGLSKGLIGQHQRISEANTFIFTIRTTSTKTVQLPLISAGTYNFYVDWGDGIKDYVRSFTQIYSNETVARVHTYPTALRDYTIKITGICRGWSYFNLTTEQPKLRSVERWGCLEMRNEASARYFVGCNNLDLSNVKDVLNCNNLTDMTFMFANILSRGINLIGNWNVSRITNFQGVFNSNSNFNSPLSSWNTPSATSFINLFSNATNFNQPLEHLSVGNVNTVLSMFSGANNFNQPLSNWERADSSLSNVTEFALMFANAHRFNQYIGNWNVINALNMNSMFRDAFDFDQDIGDWVVSNVFGFTDFMSTKTPSTFSATNLDAIYNGWIRNSLQANASISFGTAKHTAASAEGRAFLTRPAAAVIIINVTTLSTTMIVTTSGAHGLVTGNKIYINGVDPEDVNGLWTVNYISPTQVELQGSVFTSYFDGGVINTGRGWTITDGGI